MIKAKWKGIEVNLLEGRSPSINSINIVKKCETKLEKNIWKFKK